MRSETTEFFRTVLKENLSGLSFIDSDFAMLNAALAKHYGIKGVGGLQLRKVALSPEDRRGGILTHASVLLGNSSGDDTHPIKRGVWLLERLLGDPPPPPPPAVPTLAENDQTGERQSLKDKLIAHRESEACMNCHRKIDPWGIAFENYDGIGVWRDSTVPRSRRRASSRAKRSTTKARPCRRRKPKRPNRIEVVDPRTKLANGTEIQDLDDLKAYLIEHKRDEFAETLVENCSPTLWGDTWSSPIRNRSKVLLPDLREDEYRLKDLDRLDCIERTIQNEIANESEIMTTKSWHLSRRTFLRSAGVSIALPWLEGMSTSRARGDDQAAHVFRLFPLRRSHAAGRSPGSSEVRLVPGG